METRANEIHDLVRRADHLYRKWKVDTPSSPVPPTVSAPTPASSSNRRRYVAMDGLKPPLLSTESTYEDWIDFQRIFKIWGTACYESTDPIDITYDEWSRLLMSAIDTEWSERVDFDAFNTIDELIGQFDAEMQLLKPLHLRRMNRVKITHTKG